MYEELLADFFNNRHQYSQYIQPKTGLLDVIAFARDNNIGESHSGDNNWTFPHIVFNPAWNTSKLYFGSVCRFDKCVLHNVKFTDCNFKGAYFYDLDTESCQTQNVIFDRCQLDGVSFGNCDNLSILNSSSSNIIFFPWGSSRVTFENLKITTLKSWSPLPDSTFKNITRYSADTHAEILIQNTWNSPLQTIRTSFENIDVDTIDLSDEIARCTTLRRGKLINVQALLIMPNYFFDYEIINSRLTIGGTTNLKEFDYVTIRNSVIDGLDLSALNAERHAVSRPKFYHSTLVNFRLHDKLVAGDFIVQDSTLQNADLSQLVVCKESAPYPIPIDVFSCNDTSSSCVSGTALQDYLLQQNAILNNTLITCATRTYDLPPNEKDPPPNYAAYIAPPLAVVGFIGVSVFAGVLAYRYYKKANYREKSRELTQALVKNDADLMRKIEMMARLSINRPLPRDAMASILHQIDGYNTITYHDNYLRTGSPAPNEFINIDAVSDEAINRGVNAPFIRFCDSEERQAARLQNFNRVWREIKANRILDEDNQQDSSPLPGFISRLKLGLYGMFRNSNQQDIFEAVAPDEETILTEIVVDHLDEHEAAKPGPDMAF